MLVASSQAGDRRRIASAIGVILVHGAIGYAMIFGLGQMSPVLVDRDETSLIVIEPERVPPPEPSTKTTRRDPPAGGSAAMRNESPPPPPLAAVVATPVPTPIVRIAAPTTPTGGGAANGSGTAGAGSGGGSGSRDGSGTGSGSPFTPAEQIKGRFRNSDFPRSIRNVGVVKVGVRYAVQPDGSVAQCAIIEASGYAEADAMTCRVITERYRFRPARDDKGYAITEVVEEDYRWDLND